MRRHQKHIATSFALFLALSLLPALALAAQVAGTVTQLSGALLAKKGDGKVKALGIKSEVEEGDTLVSEKNTYAQIKFIDNSEITLKPGTTFKVESFSFDEGKPDGDNAAFSLVKGGLRSVTGALGKRNKEKFALKTPSATIGIRGTSFIAEWVEPDAPSLASLQAWREASSAGLDNVPVRPLQMVQAEGPAGARPPGLYVQVLDGLINLSNKGGSQNFAAGQFGFTPTSQLPPIVVPKNPGMQFTPPPVFNSSTSNTPAGGAGKAKSVDCEVR